MIKKLRIKFIVITMLSLFAFLLILLLSINIYMTNRIDKNVLDSLNMLAINDGIQNNKPPKQNESGINNETNILPPPEPTPIMNGFSVKYDNNLNIIEIINRNSNASEEEIKELSNIAIKSNENYSIIDYRQYLVTDTSYGKIVVFVDRTEQTIILQELKDLSYAIGTISLIVLFFPILLLSKWITEPVKKSFEKQKRFIADSSHELKTPLSILSANIDLIEMENKENKWIKESKKQIKRMNDLIHSLLNLTKLENTKERNNFREFNLSKSILNTILPFEVIAFENNKKIKYNIENNIKYIGNEENIKKMIEALMDNALKYSYKNTNILINLYTKGNKKIIEIENKTKAITKEQKDLLFERFYRIDESRSRENGGYGIGLSIVKSIINIHDAKIDIITKDNESIIFKIIL